MSDVVLKVEGLSKKFCKSLKRSMLYGTHDVVRDMFGFSQKQVELRKTEFWALEDINFELKRGETLGLIGQNGCGKSTLLRLINGIYPPDKGKITINGRIGALIAVGAGFHPHMTGRENIFLNGTILGMTKSELKQKMDAIIDFAEIDDFIDSPVATYSSGMTVRLGFAIAIHCEPDILLIDEILAVGDAKFQRKCLDKLREVRDKGIAVLLVSHNLQNIESMCGLSLLLNKGSQLLFDLSHKVIPKYELLMQYGENPIENKISQVKPNELILTWHAASYGGDEMKIKGIKLINHLYEQVLDLTSPNPFSIEFEIVSTITENVSLLLRFFLIIDKEKYLKDEKYAFCPLAFNKEFKIEAGKTKCCIHFNENILSTGLYSIGIRLFDYSYIHPYSQGEYGYFIVNNKYPNLLNTGKTTPFCWTNADIDLIKIING